MEEVEPAGESAAVASGNDQPDVGQESERNEERIEEEDAAGGKALSEVAEAKGSEGEEDCVKIEPAKAGDEDDRDDAAHDMDELDDQGVWQREEELPPASSDSGVMSLEVEVRKRDVSGTSPSTRRTRYQCCWHADHVDLDEGNLCCRTCGADLKELCPNCGIFTSATGAGRAAHYRSTKHLAAESGASPQPRVQQRGPQKRVRPGHLAEGEVYVRRNDGDVTCTKDLTHADLDLEAAACRVCNAGLQMWCCERWIRARVMGNSFQ